MRRGQVSLQIGFWMGWGRRCGWTYHGQHLLYLSLAHVYRELSNYSRHILRLSIAGIAVSVGSTVTMCPCIIVRKNRHLLYGNCTNNGMPKHID